MKGLKRTHKGDAQLHHDAEERPHVLRRRDGPGYGAQGDLIITGYSECATRTRRTDCTGTHIEHRLRAGRLQCCIEELLDLIAGRASNASPLVRTGTRGLFLFGDGRQERPARVDGTAGLAKPRPYRRDCRRFVAFWGHEEDPVRPLERSVGQWLSTEVLYRR